MLYFFFNDTATTEIYTLSLHDALPIYYPGSWNQGLSSGQGLMAVALVIFARWSPLRCVIAALLFGAADRKSTRLNSSHSQISYAVFCLKKKKTQTAKTERQSSVEHAMK